MNSDEKRSPPGYAFRFRQDPCHRGGGRNPQGFAPLFFVDGREPF